MSEHYRVSGYRTDKSQLPRELIDLNIKRLMSWIVAHLDYPHITINAVETWTCKECRAMNLHKLNISKFKQCKHCGDISAKTRNTQ